MAASSSEITLAFFQQLFNVLALFFFQNFLDLLENGSNLKIISFNLLDYFFEKNYFVVHLHTGCSTRVP